MTCRLALLVILCAWYPLSHAQTTQAINGFIYDAESKEALIGAVVYDASSETGAVTNSYGYYNMILKSPAQAALQVSFTGYQTRTFAAGEFTVPRFDILLKPGIELSEVTISGSRPNDISRTTETGIVRLPMRDVKRLPNLFGEVDIIKALQLTPGVQSGGESKSEMYVRGGSPDQNLIILDDVPLYYVAHFGGFLSIFNADAINDVKLIKGGFPARYGGRLSAVMDVRMKEGNENKLHGQGTLGPLSSKLMLEGPLTKKKHSFMVSARKNLLPLFRMFGTGLYYNFYDLNAKINFRLSDKDRLFVSFYNGADRVGSKTKTHLSKVNTGIKWGNLAGAVRYNRVFSNKLFANISLAYTRYQYRNDFKNEIKDDSTSKKVVNEITTGIADFIAKADLSYQAGPDYLIRFGYSGTYHRISPNDENYEFTLNGITTKQDYNSLEQAFEQGIYMEHEIHKRYFGLNAGLRATGMVVDKKTFNFIEPRINLNIPLAPGLSAKSSYALTNQFMHLLAYSGAGMPADYWMPSSANVKPSRAQQVTLGLAKNIAKGSYELSIEGYYKELDGMIAFKPGASLYGNLDSWENVIVQGGTGQNYGVEVFLQKQQGRSTGWAGVTLSKAEREFKELNNGKPFPFKYDRLIDISLVWNFEVNEKIFISTTWTYGSGYPLTLATEHYFYEGQEVFVYDEINSFKMRDYHRLDFAISFPKTTRWGERSWSISIFNLYNRKNPYYYYYDKKHIGTNSTQTGGGVTFENIYDELKLYQKTLFGIFPSISYSFKF
ncbi:MAG: TonB-dependent receptor plug domain-containing protein [Lentimicrobium sp.]|nr:TonB-dependent receptor plug domain-containing protein [Lentimicrobium sp.]